MGLSRPVMGLLYLLTGVNVELLYSGSSGLEGGQLHLVALSTDDIKFRITSTLMLLSNLIELPHFTL
jgi:hypothetical protein